MSRFIFLFPLLLFACHPRPSRTPDASSSTGSQVDEKRPVEKGPRFEVKGSLLVQGNYCGGAAPSQQMMEEARRPKPPVGMKIYVRKGTTNDPSRPLLDSSVVDDAGNFGFSLPKGSFVVLLPEQRDSASAKLWRSEESYIQIQDEKCFKTWFGKGWMSVEVTASEVSLPQQTLFKSCFLPAGAECLNYNGPYPP